MDRIKAGFYGWVLSAMKSRSQKNTNQLWFESLLQEWRGTSCKGMEVKGKQGQTLTSRTYRRHKGKALLEQELQIARLTSNSCCYWWIDNFNKFPRKSVAAIPIGPYVTINWTPCGISHLPGTQQQQLAHVFNTDGSIQAAFPKRILNKKVSQMLVQFVTKFNNFRPARFWQTSIARWMVFLTHLWGCEMVGKLKRSSYTAAKQV